MGVDKTENLSDVMMVAQLNMVDNTVSVYTDVWKIIKKDTT